MSLPLIFWTVLAIAVLIGFPIVLVTSSIQHLRGRGSERHGSGGYTAGVGAALQELDRIAARPSVEYQIEAEHRVHDAEDDKGGE